ncbi:hypothetical protein BDV25DRAFT_133607 [Aspergillus avenaceus]|uniref:Gfo/Idh/MocA-like oxidoreductase N-terminal domain-containing protein n=1 Tax=Aspergillus avenaceus TaxID=36643 RepID=A0A5N6TH14_ASPAV|nr:hypothetical protein BDV25DRAFT_133607 [Aspergillus avenaceus]
MGAPDSTTLRFLVIGAGARGNAYAQAVTNATPGIIHAVAEPHTFKRQEFGRNYIWGAGTPNEGQEFADWRDWLRWETKRRKQDSTSTLTSTETALGVHGVFICTLDETHVEILQTLAPLHLHILCEKPLALSLSDCLTVYRALLDTTPATTDINSDTTTNNSESNNNKDKEIQPKTIFSIGHVLRYSPHNILLRRLLLQDRVIGDIVSLEHCEPIGWWHFAHSYVRGNWRHETGTGDGSLLTKSCHDLDFILWLLSSPLSPPLVPDPSKSTPESNPENDKPHLPHLITSTGTLTQFHRARKPSLAGAATNCLTCAAAQSCNYNAVAIYADRHLSQGLHEWPVNIVCPDIEDILRHNPEAARSHLLSRLSEDYDVSTTVAKDIAQRPWYGRCVYESDNTVCDDQIVTLTWSDEGGSKRAKTAVFHMIAPTEKQCERRGRVYGTLGEVEYDSRSIEIYTFGNGEKRRVDVPRQPVEEKSHGGGDYGLARSFVRAVDAVVNCGWGVERAQRVHVGCTLEEAVRSHAVVFAAEEARREEKVIRWKEWWEEKLFEALGTGSSCE